MIKFAVLRSHDGHATDPLRPESIIKAGVGGHFEVLTDGKSDGIRVSVDGAACNGTSPQWPADLAPGDHTVVIEQTFGGATIDARTGAVKVIGEATIVPGPSEPEAADEPAPPAAETPAE